MSRQSTSLLSLSNPVPYVSHSAAADRQNAACSSVSDLGPLPLAQHTAGQLYTPEPFRKPSAPCCSAAPSDVLLLSQTVLLHDSGQPQRYPEHSRSSGAVQGQSKRAKGTRTPASQLSPQKHPVRPELLRRPLHATLGSRRGTDMGNTKFQRGRRTRPRRDCGTAVSATCASMAPKCAFGPKFACRQQPSRSRGWRAVLASTLLADQHSSGLVAVDGHVLHTKIVCENGFLSDIFCCGSRGSGCGCLGSTC